MISLGCCTYLVEYIPLNIIFNEKDQIFCNSKGCRKSLFNQFKRGGLVFFFESRFSHTPPNKQISTLKIFHQTADQIKILPLLFIYSLSTTNNDRELWFVAAKRS